MKLYKLRQITDKITLYDTAIGTKIWGMFLMGQASITGSAPDYI